MERGPITPANKAPGKTYAMRALTDLRKRILEGELCGGMRLFEVSLAELLNISRTPIREALFRLAEEGLLERVRGGGFVVRRFSYMDVADAIELRGVMEGMAARLAAERGVKPAALSAICNTVDKLDACFGPRPMDVDFDLYRELNASFHRELAQLCESDIIAREVDRASRLPFASPSAFLHERPDDLRYSLHTAQEQHRAIIAAITNREGYRAEALSREHALTARANLQILMKNRNPDDPIPNLTLVH